MLLFDDYQILPNALTLYATEVCTLAMKCIGKQLAPLKMDKVHRQARDWATNFTLLLKQGVHKVRCHLDGGCHTKGLAVYRRCAELLKQVLGCAPSTATEALHRELTRH